MRADLLEQTKGRDDAIAFLIGKTGAVRETNSRAQFFEKIGDLYTATGKTSFAIVAFENALRLDPHHKHARFQAAYLYSQVDATKLFALRHYRILREQDRTYSSTLNNLGVLYSELELPFSRIKLLKMAADSKEAYGYGNLLLAYVEAGFIDEAEALLRTLPEELKNEDRIVYVQGFLRRKNKEEDDKLEKLIENAEIIYQQAYDFSVPISAIDQEMQGTWVDRASRREIVISIAGEFLRIEQIDSAYKRWGIVKEIGPIMAVALQQEP